MMSPNFYDFLTSMCLDVQCVGIGNHTENDQSTITGSDGTLIFTCKKFISLTIVVHIFLW